MNVRLAATLITIVAGSSPASAKEHAMSTNSPIAHVSGTMAHAAELTVYHVDSYITTRTPIAPSALETYPDVEVHATKDRATIEKAYAEFAASEPAHATAPREYRWKLVFSDAAKHRLAEIYVAAFARSGAVGDAPIAFGNESLVKWLRAKYAPHEEHVPAQ